MLRASLLGNCGGEPEIRYSQKGDQIVTINVAVNQRRSIPNSDESKETTHWVRVRCSGWRAEQAQQLAKGQRVLAIGRFIIEEYQRRDGTPGVAYELWADELHWMSAPRDGAPSGARGERASSPSTSSPREADQLEDLPF